MADDKGAGCLKGAAIGCGSCFLLVVVLVVGGWASWGTLREMGPFKKVRTFVETAKSEAVEMGAVASRLGERYPDRHFGLRIDIQSANGVTTRTLIVDVSGPSSAFPAEAAAKESFAREVAGTVAAAYEPIARYDRLRVVLREQGDGASLGSTAEFQFATAELLPAPTPRP